MKPTARTGRAAAPGSPALRPWVDAPPPAPPAGPAEPLQRWRIVFARPADVGGASQREDLAAWEAGLAASGLPLQGLDGPRGRPRLQFAAPLGQRMGAERELADIYLVERLTVDRVRDGVAGALPPGHVLVDLHDVWLGAPALPADVTAADYRVVLDGDTPVAALADAAERLLAAGRLERERAKGTGTIRYDLRPLVADVVVVEAGPPVVLRIRVRFDAALGNGRPEEVLAALAEIADRPLVAREIVRERLVLAGPG